MGSYAYGHCQPGRGFVACWLDESPKDRLQTFYGFVYDLSYRYRMSGEKR